MVRLPLDVDFSPSPPFWLALGVHRVTCPVGIRAVSAEISGRDMNPTTDLHVNEYVELYHHYPHMSSVCASQKINDRVTVSNALQVDVESGSTEVRELFGQLVVGVY